MTVWEILTDQRGNFGGGKQKSKQTSSQQSTQTQQTQVQPMTAAESEQRAAAMQDEILKIYLGQRHAMEMFQQPLMMPYGQEAMRVLNQNFNDQQDMRGFSGLASPILNARALGQSNLLAQLQNQGIQQRLAAIGGLGTTPGALGLMGLGSQERIAGSPTTMSGSMSGTNMTSGAGSNRGFELGGFGNFLGGIGRLYAGFYPKAGTVTQAPQNNLYQQPSQFA